MHMEDEETNSDLLSNELEATKDLCKQATHPICEGNIVSIISATIVLINMVVIHSVSNAYIDELMKYLLTVLLPILIVLFVSHYKAKKLIRKLGLNYIIIHSCLDVCVLYSGDKENLKECLECGKSRFIRGSKEIPT